jgi:hypothetical protein
MRSVKILSIVAAGVLACGIARGAGRSASEALEKTVRVNWARARLIDCLADLAEQSGVGFTLDARLTDAHRHAEVSYSADAAPLALALGRALRASGLRYTIRSGSIWISTPKRVAERVLYGDGGAVPEAMPMGRGEALGMLGPVDRDTGEFSLDDPRQIHNKPWRRPESPKLNEATGLVDYPGPPIWIDSPDAGNARFKYSREPSFLKPEHLDELPLEARAENERLGRLARMIRSHPEWDRDRIIVVIEAAVAAE